MTSEEMPRPPYVLLFEEVVPGAPPLTILVDDRGAVPLFDSEDKAEAFLASTDFGAAFEAVEVSGAGLAKALESAWAASRSSSTPCNRTGRTTFSV